MPGSSNFMWSSARSEAALDAALPVPIDIRPIRSARRLRLRFDEAQRRAEAHLPVADQPPRGARLGARPARMDRRAARARRAGRAVRAGRDRSRSKAARCGSSGPQGEPRTPRLARRRAALRRPAKRSCAADRAVPQAPGARRRCRARSPSSPQRAGVARAQVSVGDAGIALGQLLVARPDPAQLAADPRPAGRCAATSSRTRSRISSTSITARDFKALEARLFGPGLAEAKAALRRVGPRLRRVGRG